MRRILTTLMLAAVIALLAGCVPREPISPAQLDEAWYLRENPWQRAKPQEIIVGDYQVPTSLTLYQEPSLVWSTVSMVKAMEKAKTGTDHLQFGINQYFSDGLADVLADAQLGIRQLARLLEQDAEDDPEVWARQVAETLAIMEKVARKVVSERERMLAGEAPSEEETEEPMGWSAGPMLQMVLRYADERTDGELLGGLSAAKVTEIREMLTQAVLKVAFAMAGREVPGRLRNEVARILKDATSEDAMVQDLRPLLIATFSNAEESSSGGRLPGIISAALEWSPRALRVMETFVRQWPKMNSVNFAFRKSGDQTIVAVTLDVRKGEEVQMAEMFFMQPQMIFRGAVRIVIEPKTGLTDDTAILFEPVSDDGAVEVRFRGAGWSLVRTLVLPIVDASLRELRIGRSSNIRGRNMINVVLLMEATGGGSDSRRLIAYHDVQRNQLVRKPLSIEALPAEKEQSFSYITPTHRYTYQRVKVGGE